jgi:UDP-N-acetylglucosamine 3-dehydrogenase
MKKPLKIGVLGAGYWGQKVVAEYQQLAMINSEINLSMVCDLKAENLTFCRETLGINEDKLSSDYNKLLFSDDLDAVHICTPNDTHHKFGLTALQAGKHVLLEKPMAKSTSDAWELVETAEKKHLCLQVGHIFRFSNALKTVRELITQEYFGDLYYLKLQWTTLMPSPLDRDIIFDLGPHPVDIMNFLLGRWPKKVSCNGKAYRREFLEEVAYINMEFEEKLMAHVELSWLQPGKVRELNIMGRERSATVDCLRQDIRIYDNHEGTGFNLDVPKNNTIFDEVSHFTKSIVGNTNHRNPGAVGASNIAVLESIKRAMKEERTIYVGLDD